MLSPFESLRQRFQGRDPVAAIREGLIGEGVEFETPLGPRRLIYADYVASGRALQQVEDVIQAKVLPFYANTHSEGSFVGATTTRAREEARALVAQAVGAGDSHAILFSGSGATTGLNQLVKLLDIEERVRRGERVVVVVGPYEHHSNLLPWRESGAWVTEIPEAVSGGPDLAALEAELRRAGDADLLVGAFSAASNVTGTLTDCDAVTRLLKAYGALAVWDYACAAPYLPLDLGTGAARKDALVFSAHKFVGGPGASGILAINRAIVSRTLPTRPGGGTVDFVSPWTHRYSADLIQREEGGTPNILGDIRAGMALAVKSMLDRDWMRTRQEDLRQRALATWRQVPGIQILGHRDGVSALPIFSLLFHRADGAVADAEAASRVLSDHYGLQTRGGCSCAGPYGHTLLGIDRVHSDALLERIVAGDAAGKPGWVRLNLSPFLDDAKADTIIATIAEFATRVRRGELSVDAVCMGRPQSGPEIERSLAARAGEIPQGFAHSRIMRHQ